jgi:hypothetical protein
VMGNARCGSRFNWRRDLEITTSVRPPYRLKNLAAAHERFRMADATF